MKRKSSRGRRRLLPVSSAACSPLCRMPGTRSRARSERTRRTASAMRTSMGQTCLALAAHGADPGPARRRRPSARGRAPARRTNSARVEAVHARHRAGARAQAAGHAGLEVEGLRKLRVRSPGGQIGWVRHRGSPSIGRPRPTGPGSRRSAGPQTPPGRGRVSASMLAAAVWRTSRPAQSAAAPERPGSAPRGSAPDGCPCGSGSCRRGRSAPGRRRPRGRRPRG